MKKKVLVTLIICCFIMGISSVSQAATIFGYGFRASGVTSACWVSYNTTSTDVTLTARGHGGIFGAGEGSNTNTYGRVLEDVTKTTSYFNLLSDYGSYAASGTTVSNGYKSYSGNVYG